MLGFGKRVGQVVGQVYCKKTVMQIMVAHMMIILGETSFLFTLFHSLSFPFFPISFSLFLFLLSLSLSTFSVFLSLLLSLFFSCDGSSHTF